LEYFFEGKKTFVMENFYRMLRKACLMEGNQPLTGSGIMTVKIEKKLPKITNLHLH
jgi:deoxyribodipyrimidine photolyase-related protein